MKVSLLRQIDIKCHGRAAFFISSAQCPRLFPDVANLRLVHCVYIVTGYLYVLHVSPFSARFRIPVISELLIPTCFFIGNCFSRRSGWFAAVRSSFNVYQRVVKKAFIRAWFKAAWYIYFLGLFESKSLHVINWRVFLVAEKSDFFSQNVFIQFRNVKIYILFSFSHFTAQI